MGALASPTEARVKVATARSYQSRKPSVALVSAAALVGSRTSRRKAASSRRNGRLGGRPRRRPSEELVGAALSPGSVFSGVLTYDPSVRDTRLWDPRGGEYPASGSLQLNLGSGLNVRFDTAVGNNLQCETPCDTFRGDGSLGLPGFYPWGNSVSFVFAGPGSALASDALPQTASQFLAAFQSGRFLFRGVREGWNGPSDGSSHELFGLLEASDVSVTPEPGSMILLGSGLLALCGRRRARELYRCDLPFRRPCFRIVRTLPRSNAAL